MRNLHIPSKEIDSIFKCNRWHCHFSPETLTHESKADESEIDDNEKLAKDISIGNENDPE